MEKDLKKEPVPQSDLKAQVYLFIYKLHTCTAMLSTK